MDHSDEQRNMGFKERHHFCFQTFYSNIRMPVHPEMVNSEGLLCAFRKLYLTKILNIPTSYPKSYTVPGYDTRDTYLYLNSEKVMTKMMIYINMYLFHVSKTYLVQEF